MSGLDDGDDGGMPDLGPCCICDGPGAVAMMMLNIRSQIPGRGWGCVQCGLPLDGAVAVLCDPCFDRYQRGETGLVNCCAGYPATDGRVLIDSLDQTPFDHDASRHPEMQGADA